MPIEQISSALERIVSLDQEPKELGSGYGFGRLVAEGPVWWAEGEYLLFSDIGNNKTMKWSEEEGVTVDREPTNQANGLTRDPAGRLIVCEYSASRVTRFESDGNTTVIADRYGGKPLNHPNDVVVKSDGSIYFTDPASDDEIPNLGVSGVYRVSADLASINLLVRDFVYPNGLAFSPNESILYINDSRKKHVRAFDLEPTGLLNLTSERILFELNGQRPGGPDGMKVDVEGNIYCTGPGGIWVTNHTGKHLGTILTSEPATNMAWGGKDWKKLFFTTRSTLGVISVNIPGVPVPVRH
jgi:gluconolactonase